MHRSRAAAQLEVADDARTAAEELARNVAELRRTKREHELAAASVQERAEQARTAQDFAERSRDAAYEAREKAFEKLRAAEAALAEERTRYTDLERQTAQLREKVEADTARRALADETLSPPRRSDTEGEDDSESVDESGGPAPTKPQNKASRSRAKPRPRPRRRHHGDDVVVASGHQEYRSMPSARSATRRPRRRRTMMRTRRRRRRTRRSSRSAAAAGRWWRARTRATTPPDLTTFGVVRVVARPRRPRGSRATGRFRAGEGDEGVIDGVDAATEVAILAGKTGRRRTSATRHAFEAEDYRAKRQIRVASRTNVASRPK